MLNLFIKHPRFAQLFDMLLPLLATLAALGALQLTQLRDDYKAQQGESYSQSSFHEAVLSAGLLPVSVLRKLLLRNPSPSLRPPPSSSGSPSK